MTISAFRARPVHNQQMPLAQPPELVQEQQPSPRPSVDEQDPAPRRSVDEQDPAPRPSVDEQDPAPRPSVDEQEPAEQSWVNKYYGQEPPESQLDEHHWSESAVHEQQSPPEVLKDGQEPPVEEEPPPEEWGEQPIRQTINRTNVYEPQIYVRFTPNPVGIGSWINLAPRPQTGALEMPCKITNGSLSTGLMCGGGSFLMAFGTIVAAVGGGHGAATVLDLALTIGGTIGVTAGIILCGVGAYKTVTWND
jgi:hypothetical protein